MALVETDIIGPSSFEDTNTHPFRVKQDSYHTLLENEILPCPKSRRDVYDCGLCWREPVHLALTECCVGYQVSLMTDIITPNTSV